MIQASIADSERIENIHPLFKQAFDFIKKTDFSKLEDGRYDIKGDNLFVSVQSLKGKAEPDAAVEIHKKYIDIQLPLEGVEKIGWIPTCNLKEVKSAYNEANDIAFYEERPTTILRIIPGQFAIFFPEDGHAPGIGDGNIRKIVVKVKLS